MSNTKNIDDFLAHHGVKGMRWGHTTGGADSGGSSSSGGSSKSGSSKSGSRSIQNTGNTAPLAKGAKPTSADIKGARKRVDEKYRDLGQKEDAYYTATTTKGREQALNVFKKAENKYMNDPDVGIAEQRTRGEKIANAATNVLIGTLIVGGIAASVASKR